VVMIHPEKRTRHILDFDDKGMPEGVRESVEKYDLNVRFETQAKSLQGSRVWGRAFRTYMLQNDIDLNDHRCLSCIAFQKDGAFVSFENISRQEAYNDEGIGSYVLNYLAQGWDLHFFRPGETTPHYLVYDEETLPVAYVEHREPAPKPVEPQKPSRWVRFANWITRGKAYSAEVTAYENSAERYPDELAAWERDWGSEIALRSYRKDKLETAAEKENSYTETLRLRQARKENAEEKKKADEEKKKADEMNKLIDEKYDTYIKEKETDKEYSIRKEMDEEYSIRKETDEEYSIREEITLDAMPNRLPKMNQRLHKITQKVDREQLKKEVEKSKPQSSL